MDIIGNNAGVSFSAASDANFAKNHGKFARIREIRGQEFYFRRSLMHSRHAWDGAGVRGCAACAMRVLRLCCSHASF
ncbi:MAG TPA: hypothetical protein PKC99_14905 [Anaerolineales bacterium]|nr:hypothetical protein [Anaerolineales bacterium]NOG75819.1 hypothetical protein [Chloroflexota bacterium]WKZ51923.1 MAG: hypothetical protein QY329_04150 [Anaerolineales bacterium]WKZ54777.1 MAG: hypothetical protein QY324_01880 [Anaerolineales bacterium]HMM99439.1 hypothetical protein [Anaerolineales bacterium]